MASLNPLTQINLKNLPGNPKKAIQISLNAGFKEVDVDTDEVKHRSIRLLTGKQILPQHWDKKGKCPSLEYCKEFGNELSDFIKELETQMVNAYWQVKSEHYKTTPELVVSRYRRLIGDDKSGKPLNGMVLFIQKHIETSDLADTTKAGYVVVFNRLKEFEKTREKKLYWEKYTYDVFCDFFDWLANNFNLSNNTLWSHEKAMIRFRNVADSKGLLVDKSKWSRLIRYQQEKKEYLSWKQLKVLIDYQPKTKRLKNAKSALLIMAFTGIRIGDLDNFFNNIKKGDNYRYANFKTNKLPHNEVYIPILAPIVEIIDSPIRVTRNAALTGSIKDLGKELGYDNISAHTGRRSFITNLVPLVQENILRKICGFSCSSSIHIYDQLPLDRVADMFHKHIQAAPLTKTEGIKLIEKEKWYKRILKKFIP